jgi:hypothetical protein
MNLLEQTRTIRNLNPHQVGLLEHSHPNMAPTVTEWCKTINELATFVGKSDKWKAEDVWCIQIAEKDGVVVLTACDLEYSENIELPINIFTCDDPVEELHHIQAKKELDELEWEHTNETKAKALKALSEHKANIPLHPFYAKVAAHFGCSDLLTDWEFRMKHRRDGWYHGINHVNTLAEMIEKLPEQHQMVLGMIAIYHDAVFSYHSRKLFGKSSEVMSAELFRRDIGKEVFGYFPNATIGSYYAELIEQIIKMTEFHFGSMVRNAIEDPHLLQETEIFGAAESKKILLNFMLLDIFGLAEPRVTTEKSFAAEFSAHSTSDSEFDDFATNRVTFLTGIIATWNTGVEYLKLLAEAKENQEIFTAFGTTGKEWFDKVMVSVPKLIRLWSVHVFR